MIELEQVLTGLVQRTEEGKLNWNRSAQNGQFVTSVDAISIEIVEIHDWGKTWYRLDIFDESGEIVDSLGHREMTAEQDQLLVRLYALARRSANDVDATLEKLVRALEL